MDNPTEISPASPANGSGASSADHGPVASPPPPGQSGGPAPVLDIAGSVLAYGGNPTGETAAAPPDERLCACGCGTPTGGKKYLDETHRKRVVRDKKKIDRPVETGLPCPLVPVQTPGDNVAGVPAGAVPAAIPWEARDVKTLVNEVILLTEEICERQIMSRVGKLGLPGEAVDEIKRDLAWNARAKEMVEAGGSELFAKLMNESGIPASYRPAIQIAIGGLQITMGHLKILKRLDLLIKQNMGQPAK